VNNIATKTKVVQARSVSKIFKRDAFEVKALDDVSIEIAGGEFMALMGPSGSGKTTLLNMIAAIDRPTKGELLVLGENIFRFSDSQSARWRNEHIGYVFQTFNLIPVLTAFENVELPLIYRHVGSEERHAQAQLIEGNVGNPRLDDYFAWQLDIADRIWLEVLPPGVGRRLWPKALDGIGPKPTFSRQGYALILLT